MDADAPYRETVGKVCDYQKRGIFGAMDMEVAALPTVAHFRGIELGHRFGGALTNCTIFPGVTDFETAFEASS